MSFLVETTDESGKAPAVTHATSLTDMDVFFDGGCPLCRREIAFYRRLRGAERIAWVDISGSDADDVAPGLSRCDAMARFHVRLSDGRLLSGGPAFAAVWRKLRVFRPFGLLFQSRAMGWLLDRAYDGFLTLRPHLQRWAAGPTTDERDAFPAWLTAELRSDHAGETGAVFIYRGILAINRDPQVRAFSERHLETETKHLALIEQILPPDRRSRLLPAWRVAGWLTGALPALFGARAVYLTIDAVETFVDRHYSDQIEALEALGEFGDIRWCLEQCRDEEIEHRDEARDLSGGRKGIVGTAWCWLVGAGSKTAVSLARRI